MYSLRRSTDRPGQRRGPGGPAPGGPRGTPRPGPARARSRRRHVPPSERAERRHRPGARGSWSRTTTASSRAACWPWPRRWRPSARCSSSRPTRTRARSATRGRCGDRSASGSGRSRTGPRAWSIDGSPSDAVGLVFLGLLARSDRPRRERHQPRRQRRRRHHLLGHGQRRDGGRDVRLPGVRDQPRRLRAGRLRARGRPPPRWSHGRSSSAASSRPAPERERAGHPARGVRRVSRSPGSASGSTRTS